MSNIQHQIKPTTTPQACVASWSNLRLNDTASVINMAQYADKSIQVHGTFAGATLRLVGSNDGNNWFVLTDAQGVDIDITQPDIKFVSEVTLYIKPQVIGGDATTDLVVTILLKE
jgi:hypothetical protein